VSLTGVLDHPSDQGDGVHARIVSSRLGLLGEWTARHSQTPTRLDRLEVKRDDFIDFVTDCRQSVEFDSFRWSPVIQLISAPGKTATEETREWSARTDFSGPRKAPEKRPLTAWEKYAQVLLLANELIFVD